MNPVAIHWVIALKAESEGLIERLGLSFDRDLSGNGFQVYGNASGDPTHRLVISGIGKVNSAAATAWLAAQLRGEPPGIWINFGIAGNGTAEIGKVFRAVRVSDHDTNRSWYPPAVWARESDLLPPTSVRTIGCPTSEYPEESITVEMEAAGFYQTALRYSSAELVQVVKVISDNRESGMKSLNAAAVSAHCREAVGDVLSWSGGLVELGRIESEKWRLPEGVNEVLETYRFSETEKHQLTRRSRNAIVLGRLENVAAWASKGGYGSGKEILRALDRLLSDAESAED